MFVQSERGTCITDARRRTQKQARRLGGGYEDEMSHEPDVDEVESPRRVQKRQV